MGHKRITTILTAAVLAVTFSGCGNEPEPEVATPAAAVVEETSAAEPAEGAESTEAAPTTEDTTEDPTTEEPTTEESTTETSAPPTTEEAAPTTGEEPAPGGDELPTTVEEYAAAYLAAGMNGDQELLERMGTDEALQASVTWTERDWEWDGPTIREGESGIVFAEYLGEGPNGLSLKIDRAAAETGAEDAVLSGELGDAQPEMTPEEYADEVVRLWPLDGAVWTGRYVAEEVVETLAAQPADGIWERTDSTEDGGSMLVTYANAESGRTLVLTVDIAAVEARHDHAVIAADFKD
ncbi:hypothetical protein NF556_09565 [Ornithinimicrobium faecis]|uniref:Lipoprotein n=1 Tax=Ornithinimicrobium faecis TaxID=2934158 RepID=A0ABY4Z0G1_9MICO|nr:hypothetical protein [Ornithinimicrobium sp. HY1793]USQ81867.1 hypothetical protein NF556_09565 [Ornithinimicrobium sp. HY1793]